MGITILNLNGYRDKKVSPTMGNVGSGWMRLNKRAQVLGDMHL